MLQQRTKLYSVVGLLAPACSYYFWFTCTIFSSALPNDTLELSLNSIDITY